MSFEYVLWEFVYTDILSASTKEWLGNTSTTLAFCTGIKSYNAIHYKNYIIVIYKCSLSIESEG